MDMQPGLVIEESNERKVPLENQLAELVALRELNAAG